MSEDDQRAILERLAARAISMDEAEQQLARLDDPHPPPGPASRPEPAPSELATERGSSEPPPTRVLPVGDPDGPVEVRLELDSGSEIEVVGNAGARQPYVEGPHSVDVHENGRGFEVEGKMGDDGPLVVPADVDLAIQANGPSLTLSGVRGSIDGDLNVGNADIRAAFTRGQSRIDANVGNLHIALHRDSNVRIQVRAATSIRAGAELVKTGRGLWSYGNGDAGLEITGNIGRLILDVDVQADLDDVDLDHLGVDIANVSSS